MFPVLKARLDTSPVINQDMSIFQEFSAMHIHEMMQQAHEYCLNLNLKTMQF